MLSRVAVVNTFSLLLIFQKYIIKALSGGRRWAEQIWKKLLEGTQSQAGGNIWGLKVLAEANAGLRKVSPGIRGDSEREGVHDAVV